MKAVFGQMGGEVMHLVKEHLFEMAQEGAKLTKEERLHLENCKDCSNMFRMFVLHRYYRQRASEQLQVECIAR